MKYGARNQLTGTVRNIKRGNVMGQITLDVPANSVMGSVMTLDSIDGMELKEGDSVRIVVKAINVLLVKE